jgi:hypothetical protein
MNESRKSRTPRPALGCSAIDDHGMIITGYVVRMEQHRIPKNVQESCFGGGRPVGRPQNRCEDVMQPTCSGFGTGRLQQEIGRSGGRRLGRP